MKNSQTRLLRVGGKDSLTVPAASALWVFLTGLTIVFVAGLRYAKLAEKRSDSGSALSVQRRKQSMVFMPCEENPQR